MNLLILSQNSNQDLVLFDLFVPDLGNADCAVWNFYELCNNTFSFAIINCIVKIIEVFLPP